jgi:hypothetical protein
VSNQGTPATDNGAEVLQGGSNKKSSKRQGQATQVATQQGTHEQSDEYSGEYLDLQAVAQALGVSMNTVRRKRKAGELQGAVLQPSAKGERWLVPVATVQKLQGTQQGTQVSNQAADLATQVQRLEAELAAKQTEIEQQRAYSTQIATDLQHQVELQTLRADSHEQIAIERLRVLQMQELTLALSQRKVLELETAASKKRHWWQKSKTPAAVPQQGSVITDTTAN